MALIRRKFNEKSKRSNSVLFILLITLGSFILGFLIWNGVWYYSIATKVAPKLEDIGITDYSPLQNMINCYVAQLDEEYSNSEEFEESIYYEVYNEEYDIYYSVRTPFYLFDKSYCLRIFHTCYNESFDVEYIGEAVEFNFPSDSTRNYYFQRIEPEENGRGYVETGATYIINQSDDNLKQIIPIEVNPDKETVQKSTELYEEYKDTFIGLESLAKEVWGEGIFEE